MAPHRRPRPELLRLARRAGDADAAGHDRDERADAVVPLPPGDRGPGVRDARLRWPDDRRVVLGLGTGESLNEVPLGIEWPDQKERFARLKEATELIRKLWTEKFVTFEGEFFKTHNATIYDRPERPVEFWIAASGPAAARLAGRVADGFICTSGKGMELYSETLLPAVAEGAEKAGRSTDAIEKMIEVKVSYDSDRKRALQDCGIWAALALPGETKMGVDDPREMERLAAELPLEQAATPLARLGRPRRARRADPALHRAGLHPPGVPRPGQQPVPVHQRSTPATSSPLRERCG